MRTQLYSLGCPGAHSIAQAGLELRNPSASASQSAGITGVHQHCPVHFYLLSCVASTQKMFQTM